jgi:hypothetical protein
LRNAVQFGAVATGCFGVVYLTIWSLAHVDPTASGTVTALVAILLGGIVIVAATTALSITLNQKAVVVTEDEAEVTDD